MKSTPARAPLSTRWCWRTGPMRSTSCSGVASASRRHPDDVARHDEPDHLRRGEGAAQLRVGGARASRRCGRRPRARGTPAASARPPRSSCSSARAPRARHAAPEAPTPSGRSRRSASRAGRRRPRDPLDELGRVDRHVERLGEERRLALEVVVHERGVDPRLAGDAAQARLVVSLGSKGLSRGVDDRGARVGARPGGVRDPSASPRSLALDVMASR